MKTAIVIPYLNHWDLVHARLGELYKFAPKDCEIVLVDDASTDPDCITGAAFWQKQASRMDMKIRYYKNSTNLGFGGAMNIGAKIARVNHADITIFHSNDVVIYGDYISPIRELLLSDPKTLIGGELVWWAAGWNEFDHNGKKVVIPYLNGWLLACMTKGFWKDLGGFDLRYGKYDYEDVDLSTQALYMGYNLQALNSKYLAHMGAATIRELNTDRLQVTIEHRKLYEHKWIPRLDELVNKLEKTDAIAGENNG